MGWWDWPWVAASLGVLPGHLFATAHVRQMVTEISMSLFYVQPPELMFHKMESFYEPEVSSHFSIVAPLYNLGSLAGWQ